MGCAWSREKLVVVLSRDLGPAGPDMAKLVIDAAKCNSKTGSYDVAKDVCIRRFRDRSIPDQLGELVSLIDASDRKKMTTFHTDVIEPLVREFLKTRFDNPILYPLYGRKRDVPTPARMISFRNALYHYQFACNMATRYQRNGNGACRDISLTKDEGEIKMLDNISGLYLKGEERFHLVEIVDWVESRYGKLIEKVQKGRPMNEIKELSGKFKVSLFYFITDLFLQKVF